MAIRYDNADVTRKCNSGRTLSFEGTCVDTEPNCAHINICADSFIVAKKLCKRFCNLCDVGKCFALHNCYLDTKMYVRTLSETRLEEHYKLVTLIATCVY